ncbi:hypothetical protein BHE18_16720 [Rossellomorea aquimaris]|uniref:Uncharacterized protein n=1 Tax=Rossellomorea aquimaris TaxID=189382 RepID=A0A1J6VTI6_9BACI|nr:hypothetical protein BHE18_16720 [Rossellomorea aquimaris]
MFIIIGSIILWCCLVGYAIKTFTHYKRSSEVEKQRKHGFMIKVVGSVPLAAILITGQNLTMQGYTMEQIKPYLFIAALITIFIPGYIYLLYTLFSEDSFKNYNDPGKYKSSYLYIHRKVLMPITVTVPIIILTIYIYNLGVKAL